MRLIDVDAAIDAVLSMTVEHRVSWKDVVIDLLDDLPTVEPQIIRCNGGKVAPDHYCRYSEGANK